MATSINYLNGNTGKYLSNDTPIYNSITLNSKYLQHINKQKLSKSVSTTKATNGFDRMINGIDQTFDDPNVQMCAWIIGPILGGVLVYRGLKKIISKTVYSSIHNDSFLNWDADKKAAIKRQKMAARQQKKILKQRRKNPYFLG
ncbi:MAG: hypothetical protein KAS04_02405 [Candidatus Aenigmarchaeota archaeon]|nr:hypothetical protein [Candidatus Aenigmarchaeota archaeon]